MRALQRRRHTPARVFDPLEERLHDLFEGLPSFRSEMPAVDVREEDDRYVVEADLPGMSEDDVDVTVDDSVLTISSSKQEEKKDDDEKGYLRHERRSMSFTRRFTLPSDSDPDDIKADFNNGLLTLEIPRTEEKKPRKIPLKKS